MKDLLEHIPRISGLWSVLVLLHLPMWLWSQCSVDTNIHLREVDTLNLTIDIEGAINNDLSDPDQGLCKIRVNFTHEFLGDLQIFIESPSGQIVQLTGPTGNFGLTQFSEWDVCFVPNSMAPVPDPGFANRWSNNQLWGSFAGTYTGSYHVFFGDLANLNTGPVNGTWTIRFVDRTIFYTGQVLGYELSFCDSTGIMCRPCEPGIFDFHLPDSVACEGDSTLIFNLAGDYTAMPDTNIYDEEFFVLDSSRTILGVGPVVDLTTAPPGSYQICGVGYYSAHRSLLPIPGEDWQDFLDSVRNGDIAVCFAQMGCRDVRIFANSDTLTIDTSICAGDSVVVFEEVFKDSGDHLVYGNSFSGCDSIVLLRLNSIELTPVILGDTLDCTTSEVTLDGTGSLGPPGLDLQWSTNDGVIRDTLRPGVIVAAEPGTYTLHVKYGGCSESLDYVVLQDNDVPDVTILGDTIDCLNSTVSLEGVTNAQNPAYEWVRNGSVLGMEDTLLVADSGRYLLRVMDQNGCINEGFFIVVLDTIPPQFLVRSDSITCLTDSVVLGVEGNIDFSRISWLGPGGTRGSGQTYKTGEPGLYNISVTGTNGCESDTTILVNESREPPDLTILNDTISCLKPRIDLEAISGRSIIDYSWSGPGGVTSDGPVFTVDRSGTYNLEVTASNGCTLDTMIVVPGERELLGMTILSDSLDCQNDSPKIWFRTMTGFAGHFWRTPDGRQLDSDSIDLDRPGQYVLFVRTDNGCIYSDTVFVRDSRNEYNVTLIADTITCFRPMAGVSATSEAEGLSYRWFYRGQEIRRDSAFVTVFSGLYILEVTDISGCTFTDSVFVNIDTATADISISGPRVLTCKDTEVILETETNGDQDQIEWMGPDNFVSNDSAINANREGVYIVSVTTDNGCVSKDSVEVTRDTMAPEVMVTSDTLNCIRTTGQLNVINPGQEVLYVWRTPDSSEVRGDMIFVDVGGRYLVVATDTSNGCRNMAEGRVFMDTIPPQILVPDLQIPCGGDSLLLYLADSSNTDSVTWGFPDGSEKSSFSVNTVLSGNYNVFVRGINGCVSEINFEVTEGQLPEAITFPDSITCQDDSVRLHAEWGSEVDSFYWYNAMAFRSQQAAPYVNQPGEYYLVLTSDGCIDTFRVEVGIDTTPPDIRIIQEGILGCESDNLFLEAFEESPGTGIFDFDWRRIDNDSLLGETKRIQISQEGDYELSVGNRINGCVMKDSIVISRDENSLERLLLAIKPPSCRDGFDGSVTLDSVIGGLPPFLMGFDGLGFSFKTSYDLLEAGEYIVTIRDAAGCELDTVITIGEGASYQLSLGPDTTIQAGDSIILNPVTAPDAGSRRSLTWYPDQFISSTGEFNPTVSPDVDITYTLSIETVDGCIVSDDIRVFVDEDPKFYVPNIFSPNGDGLNDELEIFIGSGVDAVISFSIFDRWGNLVFSIEGPRDGSPVKTWDGTFRGQICPPGVYAFSLEIRTLTGQIRQYSGDLTIIR